MADWFGSLNAGELPAKVLFSIIVLALVFLAVLLANRALNRAVFNMCKTRGEDPESPGFLISAMVLIKSLILYAGVLSAVLAIFGIFEFRLVTPENIAAAGVVIIKTIAVIIGARLIVKLVRLAVGHIFSGRITTGGILQQRRVQTLEPLLVNAASYLVYFVAGITVLQIFNVNTGAILASAGIIGLAVGFGAQNLVRDILSGFFILFEDQFAVGDFVEAGGCKGVVEEIGLRTCKIRAWTGQLNIIPNGEISKVTNYSRGDMLAVAVVSIAYEENINRAIEVLRHECEAIRSDMPSIIETPVVQGVIGLDESSVQIRVIARSLHQELWAVEREMLKRLKTALDRAGIEIPYPKRVIISPPQKK